jgi:hypothetical protein
MTPGTQVRLTAMMLVGLVLGGGSTMGSVRLSNVTFGLRNGLFVGSDVGISVH